MCKGLCVKVVYLKGLREDGSLCKKVSVCKGLCVKGVCLKGLREDGSLCKRGSA